MKPNSERIKERLRHANEELSLQKKALEKERERLIKTWQSGKGSEVGDRYALEKIMEHHRSIGEWRANTHVLRLINVDALGCEYCKGEGIVPRYVSETDEVFAAKCPRCKGKNNDEQKTES